MNCAKCGAGCIQAKDALCRSCRVRSHAILRTKYRWTPEMDELLVRAYRQSKNKSALSKAKKALAIQWRMPGYILQNRANTLGIRQREQRLWTSVEIERLREFGGTLSLTKLASKLGRTESSVKNRLFILGLGCRVVEGYSQNELGKLFGVHHNKVGRWIARGWITLDGVSCCHAGDGSVGIIGSGWWIMREGIIEG